MLRVDAHVHAFPDRLALAVREHLNREGRLQAGPLVADVAAGVEAAGFDAAWMLPYAHRAGVAASANEWSASAGERFSRLIAGATFHPDDEDLSRQVERALVELQLRVVKLHCSVGRFLPSDARLQPLWELASALAVPVLVHAGRYSPGETAAAEIDELEPVLRAHPELRLVLAHTGFPHSARALALMAEHPHLYADVTPVWDRPVQVGVRELTEFAGRFLFGSDAPNNPVTADVQAGRFESLGLEQAALDQLLGGAACSLVPTEGAPQ